MIDRSGRSRPAEGVRLGDRTRHHASATHVDRLPPRGDRSGGASGAVVASLVDIGLVVRRLRIMNVARVPAGNRASTDGPRSPCAFLRLGTCTSM